MEFRIADSFTDSVARLTCDEQKAVKTTASSTAFRLRCFNGAYRRPLCLDELLTPLPPILSALSKRWRTRCSSGNPPQGTARPVQRRGSTLLTL